MKKLRHNNGTTVKKTYYNAAYLRLHRVLVLILILAMVFCFSACSKAADSVQTATGIAEAPVAEPTAEEPLTETDADENAGIMERFPIDPTQTPDNTMGYVILSGSWYDMGYQYGQQDPVSVVQTALSGVSKANGALGTNIPDEMYSLIAPYEELLRDWFPAILDFCHGCADATGMNYYDMLLGYVVAGPNNLPLPEDKTSNSCSMVAAWGEATENGDLVAAYNSDRPMDATSYQACIIALPEDGNAFICARDFMGPTMNETGLVVMSTGGQGGLEDDVQFGVPYSLPIIYAAAYCDTAEEAYKAIDAVSISGALNVMISDGNVGYQLETTSSHKAWRECGDFGETDYLIANNHYLTEEMQSSLLTDHSYDDCPYRYATVEQFIKRDFGSITVETLRQAEGSTSFYDFETGEWVENVWDPRLAYNAPEALSDSFKTSISHIANATTQTVYECRGQQETLSSYVPDALGVYSQVTLDKDPGTMVNTAGKVLAKLLVKAAGEIDISGNRENESRMNYLNMAKEQNFIGYNYTSLADSSCSESERLYLYAMALNAYCDGQCYARMACDTPSVIS